MTPKPKVLGVAEKPEAAKQIATILSGNKFKKREGKSKFNKVFEFDYRMNGQVVTMCITSVLGHLMELDFEGKFRSWASCDPMVLMDVSTPVIRTVPEKHTDIEKNLENEARNASKLILWLDCDREGENIAFEVVDVCTRVNRALSIDNNTILRARFSEFTPAAINRAIRTLERPNILDSMAVDARQELDLRIGASFTRFQSMRLQKKFHGLPGDVISYGPCQFPTLGFVVKRDLLIKNFESEKFWTLNCCHDMGEEGKAQFLWKRGRLFDHLSCLILYELCVENPTATVTRVDKKRRTKQRPIPLNTIELQKLASQKLRMSSHDTMKVAESLYNKGFISYPRTETNNYNQFSDDDLKNLIQEHSSNPIWGQYAADLLNGGYRKPTSGKQDDKAHPPIHPLKGSCQAPDQKEQDLYELISRHFLACCSQDALGSETKVHIVVANEEFTCSGLMVEQKNYLEIWKYDKWSDKSIPVFQQNQQFVPTSLLMDEGETRPPPHLSESDLISAMDSNGIGTDATVAQHIKTIQDRGYVIKRGNRFEASNLGIALLQGYDLIGYELSTPNLRAKMEKDMVCISQGQITKDAVINQSLAMYKHVFMQICKSAHLLDKAVQQHFKPIGESGQSKVLVRSFSMCGCGNSMDLKEQDGHRFLFCKNCKEAYNLPSKCEYESISDQCPLCNFQVLNVTTQKSNYNICPNCFNNPPDLENAGAETYVNGFRCYNCTFQDCKYSRKKEAFVRNCPKCSKNMVVKQTKEGNFYIGCKGFPACRTSVWMPKSITGVEATSEKCLNCSTRSDSVFKTKFKISRDGTFLPSHIQSEHVTCVFCDSDFNEIFNISLSALNQNDSNNEHGSVAIYNNTTSGRSRAAPTSQTRTSPQATTSRTATTLRKSPSNTGNQITLDKMLGKRTGRDFGSGSPSGHSSMSSSTGSPSNTYNRSGASVNASKAPQHIQRGNSNQSGGEDKVNCPHCGALAIKLVCKKAGDNQGRQFWKCPNKDGDCPKFFQWAD